MSEFLLLAIVRVLTLLMFGISRSHQNFIFKNQNNRLSLVPKCCGANSDLSKCFWLSSRAHKTILPLAWRVCLVCHCFLLSSFVGEVICPWEGSLEQFRIRLVECSLLPFWPAYPLENGWGEQEPFMLQRNLRHRMAERLRPRDTVRRSICLELCVPFLPAFTLKGNLDLACPRAVSPPATRLPEDRAVVFGVPSPAPGMVAGPY